MVQAGDNWYRIDIGNAIYLQKPNPCLLIYL